MTTAVESMLRAGALASVLCAAPAFAQRADPAAARSADRPIKVAAVSTLSGPGASPESVRGAQAYFDAVNAAGGVRGRKLVLLSVDDRADPAAAAAAAAALVADAEVVALAGGSSVLECAVNHRRYEAAGLMSLPGGAIDPQCFRSPAIAPVNAGPYVSMANALSFVRDVLRLDRPCVVSPALPGMTEAFTAALQGWARQRGAPLPPMALFTIGEPLEPIARRMANDRCRAVVFTGPNVVEWARQSRPLLPGVPQVFLTPAYTTAATAALSELGEGLHAMAEFEPWTSRSLQLTDWRGLMVASKVPLSSLSQGGYLAAQMLVRAMNRIPGPITRASVAQALRDMPAAPNALTAEPFSAAAGRQPNRSAIPMVLKRGRWEVAHPQWITQASN